MNTDGVFTEAEFEQAQGLAQGEWYMRTREQLERCSQPSENPGDMREVRIMLTYRPELAMGAIHPYIVEHAEFVDGPDSPPVTDRQRECLATLRGSRLDLATSFTDIPETHRHLMITEMIPAP